MRVDLSYYICKCMHVYCLICRRLRHPYILLLMGVCPTNNLEGLVLLYERVGCGSLFHYLHQRVGSTFLFMENISSMRIECLSLNAHVAQPSTCSKTFYLILLTKPC